MGRKGKVSKVRSLRRLISNLVGAVTHLVPYVVEYAPGLATLYSEQVVPVLKNLVDRLLLEQDYSVITKKMARALVELSEHSAGISGIDFVQGISSAHQRRKTSAVPESTTLPEDEHDETRSS